MPLNINTALYGRHAETDEIFRRFAAGKNLLMLGPRRLGKTFVLERLEERAESKGYCAIRFDVSHCQDENKFFTKLCDAVTAKRGSGENLMLGLKQKMSQLWSGSAPTTGSWYQAALNTNWESFAEQLITALAEDKEREWLLLMDELPVFLLHLQEKPTGLAQAKSISYRLRAYREDFPRLHWLITGSIGIAPLARQGDYFGAFNNLEPFELKPLSTEAATALIHDWAGAGLLEHRQMISHYEAEAIIEATGWLSAYYLEALTKQLQGEPANDAETAQLRIDEARKHLLQPANRDYFTSWSEHISKNFPEPKRGRLLTLLTALSEHDGGLTTDTLMAKLNDPNISRQDCQRLLNTLEEDGFIITDYDNERHRFRMELLRLWWQRYLPE